MNSGSPLLDSLCAALNRARDELSAWASPVSNPFAAQARAQEAHRPTLWRAILVMAALWCAPMLIALSAGPGDERDAAGDAALAWIGAVLVVILTTRIARCIGLMRVEVLKNRFEPLQIVPIPSARRAWLWCAPVSQFAFMLGILALPALAWELGSHRLALHDAIGLGFLALVFGWGTPLWRPHVWRAQINKTGAHNASQSDGFVPPTLPKLLQSDVTFWTSGVFLVIMALAGAGAIGEAPTTYWQQLPAHLRATGAQFWLNWPLFGARWLTEAQPFFGFSLAPILVLAPVWVASVHNTIMRLGAVTALEPYWTPARQFNWWRAGRLQTWGLTLFCGGILWAGAIRGAWLSAWFFGAPRRTDWALAAWWIIALFVGLISAAARWKRALDEPTGAATPPQRRLQIRLSRASKAATRPFLWALITFAISCVVGWAWPFGTVWRQILPASLAVAATWLGAALTTTAAQRIPRYAGTFLWLNGLWFYGGPLLCVALHYVEIDLRPLKPQIYFLSPWSLWWTLRQPAIASFPLFWAAICAHFALIGASALVVWRSRHSEIGPVTPEAMPDFKDLWTANAHNDESNAESPATPDKNATDENLFDDEDEDEGEATPVASAVLNRPNLPAPDAELSRVLGWQSRLENPLLPLETRRVIGNGLRGTCELALILSGANLLLLTIILPAWGFYQGAYPAEFAAVALAVSLLIWCLVPLKGIEGTSRCYDHDRVDGSLQMLFLTPLTEREIAIGKIGPFLTRAALLLAFYSPLWLMGFLPALYFHEPIIVVVYLFAPLFAASFALRIAALSHWTALKKRAVGTFSVPAMLVFSALWAVPAELALIGFGMGAGAVKLAGALLILTLIFWAEAALFWWLSLRQLRHRRFLDAPVGR